MDGRSHVYKFKAFLNIPSIILHLSSSQNKLPASTYRDRQEGGGKDGERASFKAAPKWNCTLLILPANFGGKTTLCNLDSFSIAVRFTAPVITPFAWIPCFLIAASAAACCKIVHLHLELDYGAQNTRHYRQHLSPWISRRYRHTGRLTNIQ